MNKFPFLDVETDLVTELENSFANDFCNCYTVDKPNDIFYSSFIMALIGLFLKASDNPQYNARIDLIYKKLLHDHNLHGMYNFYGDSHFHYDIDCTSIINLFLFLCEKDIIKHKKIIEYICANSIISQGGLQTWFNLDKYSVDWFANYNFFVYHTIVNKSPSINQQYLIDNYSQFFSKGSEYYKDTLFPKFLITFYKKEYSILLNNLDVYITGCGNDFINQGINILRGDKLIDFNSLNYKKYKNMIYFNGINLKYSSKQLDAAIKLYLLNTIRKIKTQLN